MVEATDNREEEENKTFIDTPAILDKYKAAAVVTDCKYQRKVTQFLAVDLTY